jgi:Sulfotransferase family
MPSISTVDYPVFVMGAERSGTSTIAAFLHDKLGYAGNSEGHVFNLLQKILFIVNKHFIDSGFHVDTAKIHPDCKQYDITTAELISQKSIESALHSLWATLISNQLTGLWFDKTPGPDFIKCASKLYQMYPNARFIFLIRDPVSSVESSMRKFGSTFEEACNRWSECAEAWLQTKGGLPEECFIELKTHELSSKTADCLDRMANLLTGHPFLISSLEMQRMQLTSIERTSTTDISRTKSLESSGWTLEQKQIFLKKCSCFAEIFGFSEDREYDGGSTAAIHFPPPYGQRNVEITHGDKGGVWPQLHDGKICIFMHPSIGEPLTSIFYHNLDVPTGGEISAIAHLLREAADSVAFEIQILESANSMVLHSTTCVCAPGESKEIRLHIPLAVRTATIIISTRSLSTSVNKAWALISTPVFMPKSPN